MENKYDDAIDRAFNGDEKIISDWTREARGKILDIQNELDNLDNTPAPKLKPKDAPFSNNFSRRVYLESEKQNVHIELSKKIDQSFAHKTVEERDRISGKVNNLLDPKHPDLKKKSLDASQDYVFARMNSNKSHDDKIEDNNEALGRASDRFEQKLSSYKEINLEKAEVSKEDVLVNDTYETLSDRFEMSFASRLEETSGNSDIELDIDKED
jgi:hypothetical protein